MLECRDLVKKYRSLNAVDGVSLQLREGRVYALLGPNGSGKSTFMKMAAGLICPTGGELLFDGGPLREKHKAQIAYMPTEPYFYSYMSWKDAGKYYRDFYKDFSMELYEQLLEKFELSPKMKITKVSSGMAAKGRIALALSRDARLVMLDEPLNGIDIIARDQILECIRSHRSPKKAILISSHLVDELETLADEAIFIRQGRIVVSGAVEELTAHHEKSLTELYREIYIG